MIALGLSFPIVGSGQFYNGGVHEGGRANGCGSSLGLVLSAGGDNVDNPDGNLDADNDDWRSIPGYVFFLGGVVCLVAD